MLRAATIASSIAAASADVSLVSFDGQNATTFEFKELNDPVMGGKSTGTWTVSDGFGVFDGEVVDVPSLSAPGFIKAAADGTFNDASIADGGDLLLYVRSTTPEFTGFKVAVVAGASSGSYSCSGGGSLPLSRGCYKSNFAVPAGSEFSTIRVPFKSFSDLWSPATGEQTRTCAQQADTCIGAKQLKAITRIEVWAEGAAGKVHLELQGIGAAEAKPASQIFGSTVGAFPGSDNDFCSGPVQGNLLYGVTGRDVATVPVPVDDGETLAQAVCCDKRMLPFAEPQFLYAAPDVDLFTILDKAEGVTTFFDSVCGLPLFKTPVNRTLDAFKEDTTEHGWPSFRTPEIVFDNVVTDMKTGYITSKCGTHLGSYLPDEEGPRWCIDLSCASGVAL